MPDALFNDLGWGWFLGQEDEETWEYFVPELLAISKAEQETYSQAADTLYQMYIEATQHVLSKRLWEDLGIPRNMEEMIYQTWNDDRHIHLFSRFDFAGGLEGQPIKLIEFNADTATVLPEAAIIQRAQLKFNGISESLQFNQIYQNLVNQLTRLRVSNPDLYPTLLVTTMGHPEDEANGNVIGDAAKDAGFEVEYELLEDVIFSEEEGIFVEEDDGSYTQYNFWYKLVPWEFIAFEEPELMDILTKIVRNRQAVIVNPAYTLLFQSKAMMRYLWDLHPNHPLLLKTTAQKPSRFASTPYVEKVIFGREGENITIYNQSGKILDVTDGDFGRYPSIFQEFVELPKDSNGNYYQPGIYYVDGACGLGIRRCDSLIVDEDAEFVGHYIG